MRSTRYEMHTQYTPQSNPVGEIIRAYDPGVIKAYCWARFQILHQRFLDEIGQYLPRSGRVLDVGCGFGLFSLYYAKMNPFLDVLGIDLNPLRIQMARTAAARLQLSNVHYQVGDVTSYEFQATFDGVYMLDIVHHVPRQVVRLLTARLHKTLRPGCRLIIKDVETVPQYKLWWTYVLDKLMDMRSEVSYWEKEELIGLLRDLNFEVFRHSMVDILPYPHILYVCQKLG